MAGLRSPKVALVLDRGSIVVEVERIAVSVPILGRIVPKIERNLLVLAHGCTLILEQIVVEGYYILVVC